MLLSGCRLELLIVHVEQCRIVMELGSGCVGLLYVQMELCYIVRLMSFTHFCPSFSLFPVVQFWFIL